MAAPTTKSSGSTSVGKHETTIKWLQRRLRKVPSIQAVKDEEGGRSKEHMPLHRPQTASAIPTVPSIPIHIQQPLSSLAIPSPPFPPRPNSGIVRNVNAWLDASMSTPSPPLMGGVSYWKMAVGTDARDTAGIQHAMPIVQKPETARPLTSPSNQMKVFRRHAKKIQVQMPRLGGDKSQRIASRKQINRRSNSMPILGIPYEMTQEGAPPRHLGRAGVFLTPSTCTLSAGSSKSPTESKAVSPADEHLHLLEQPRIRYDSPASARTSDAGSIERRMHALFKRRTRSADSTRPSTAAAPAAHEGSMGSLSDAPTYFSGPPPPSYRSRPDSILTTSSFGCIDGMNPAQRQISQQRAAVERGVKGKLKRFAQNFAVPGG
ncbi:hypothetical protein GQ44DRAFT_714173 [Phaeosphaeriaceae sp. PMI808]|nr:hypothetical protein GQ44DRAFT_714173 [Phaeosphaeriaceae sp. PMI808]